MSTRIPTTPPIRIASPDDLAALVPYLLGYHPDPEGDLVVLGIRGKRIVTVARMGLPVPDDAAGLAAEVLDKLTDHAKAVIVIGYGPAARITPVIDQFRRDCRRQALKLQEAMRISDGRAYSYLCTNPACHPIEGTCVDPAGAAAMAAIATGLTAAASREEFASRLAPVTGASRTDMRQATDRVTDNLRSHGLAEFLAYGLSVLHAVIAAAEAGRRATDEQAAALGVLCAVPGFAEGALSHLEGSQVHTDLWTDITRRVEPDYTAGPAALLAYAAWRRGDGALAWVAVERALQSDPTHSLAELMGDLLDAGAPPSILDEVRKPR